MRPVWVLSAVCLLGALAGCSHEAELTFMTGGAPHEFLFYEEICRDFEEQSGIPITLIRSATQTEQRKQQIMVGLRGHEPDPDVFLMDIAWIGQLASSGWLEPLNEHGLDGSAFFPNIVNLADRHDGDLIGLPFFVDAGLLYYRTDLLRKHGYDGPPETWTQLLEMARTVQAAERETDPDFFGFAWQGAQYEGLVCNALEFFASAGGGFVDENDQPVLDTPANLRALRFMRDLIHEHAVSPPNTYTEMKEEEVRRLFHNGQALFERNWPYAQGRHAAEDSPVRGRFAVAPLPHFEGHHSAAALGGYHVAVSRHADRKADAVAFVRYLTSYEVQKRMVFEITHNPGRTDVYRDPAVKDTPTAALEEVFYQALPRPTVPYYPRLSQTLQKHLNAALSGRATPEQALSKAQAELEQLVAEYAR